MGSYFSSSASLDPGDEDECLFSVRRSFFSKNSKRIKKRFDFCGRDETPEKHHKNSKKKYAKKKKKKKHVLPSFFSSSRRREEERISSLVSFERSCRHRDDFIVSDERASERRRERTGGEGREGGGEYVVNVLGERNAFTTSTRDEEDEDEDDDALLDRARIFCESLDRRVVSREYARDVEKERTSGGSKASFWLFLTSVWRLSSERAWRGEKRRGRRGDGARRSST